MLILADIASSRILIGRVEFSSNIHFPRVACASSAVSSPPGAETPRHPRHHVPLVCLQTFRHNRTGHRTHTIKVQLHEQVKPAAKKPALVSIQGPSPNAGVLQWLTLICVIPPCVIQHHRSLLGITFREAEVFVTCVLHASPSPVSAEQTVPLEAGKLLKLQEDRVEGWREFEGGSIEVVWSDLPIWLLAEQGSVR